MSNAHKIPKMNREEYDSLIRGNVVSRIAFSVNNKPYIAPFIYIFEKNRIYFLSTRYGKKINMFSENPYVSVEIENVAPDMEHYRFVTLSGRLEEITDEKLSRNIKEKFADLIITKRLSSKALAALGYESAEPPEKIITENRAMVWVLKDVSEIVALKEA